MLILSAFWITLTALIKAAMVTLGVTLALLMFGGFVLLVLCRIIEELFNLNATN